MEHTFASRIKELRTSLNITQTELASELNTTQAALSAYEKGDRTPSVEILKSLAKKYSVSIDWLCGLSDTKKLNKSIVTYADLYKFLFEIYDATDLRFLPNHIEAVRLNYYTGDPEPYTEYIKTLYFNNTEIEGFLDEWDKMKTLRDNETIDDDVYALWMEKTLNKASKQNLDGSFVNDLEISSFFQITEPPATE